MTRFTQCLAVTLSIIAVTIGGLPGTSAAQHPEGQIQPAVAMRPIHERAVVADAHQGGAMIIPPFFVGTPPSPLLVSEPWCCIITAINVHTGIVTAKETATGHNFEFEVTDAKLRSELKVGQPVYANLSTKQVSLDGQRACPCRILSEVASGGGPGSPMPPAAAPQIARPEPWCCIITAINVHTGIVTAKETATGHSFEFEVTDAKLRSELKVGQPVYANLSTKQVSLDGQRACPCRILSEVASGGGPGSPMPPAAAPQIARPQALTPFSLPTVSVGTPYAPPKSLADRLAQKRLNANVLHLRGFDGIAKAEGLHEDAKELLLMHAMTLPPGESDHYIVNKTQAEEWMKTHPVPASAKPSKGGGHTGCHKLSMHCAGEAAKHAGGEASRQYQKTIEQATEDWRHVTDEAAHDWNMAEGCFVDHRLPFGFPVKGSIPLEYPLSFEKDGKEKLSHGSASGKVKGTVTVGVPLTVDFQVQGELFYLPCLPFVVRPRNLGAEGTLEVDGRITATVNATGQFDEVFTIPPPPIDPRIPISVLPIIILGVPVVEVDVSIHLDGTVDVGGEGVLDGHFKLNIPQKTAFKFECSGKGCEADAHRVPEPVTTAEDVTVTGRLHVKPAIYTALQLDFEVDAFSARAGPEPYLWGALWGCSATSAQSTGASATAQKLYALTADLDWGIDLRAEALVEGKRVGPELRRTLLGRQFLWFKDLAPAGSENALTAGVQGITHTVTGAPSKYKLKMRQCYPYTEKMEYLVTWSGGAIATTHPECTWQAGQGTCRADPKKDLTVEFVWPKAGSYALSVVPVRDAYGRVFRQESSTQLNINVLEGGSPPASLGQR